MAKFHLADSDIDQSQCSVDIIQDDVTGDLLLHIAHNGGLLGAYVTLNIDDLVTLMERAQGELRRVRTRIGSALPSGY